jgi:hypothetical protein
MLSNRGIADVIHGGDLLNRETAHGHEIETCPLHLRERIRGALSRGRVELGVKHRLRPG